MATIQQLIRSSKPGRVQTADLAEAPNLQPTISAGGRYTVQVQQAGKNKWNDLADALSQVNPALREYAAASDLEAKQYEDELSRMSREEVLTKLKQSEAALDKEVRRGNIPFLGSPLNWKRKKRALGAAAHDAFQLRLTGKDGRLLGGKQEGDDDKSTSEIIQEEMAAFIEENPALKDTFTGEGFQQAINPTIQNLTDRYDTQKSKQAELEVGRGFIDSAYRLAKDGNHESEGEWFEVTSQIQDLYQDLNAFTPQKQIAAITAITKSLARVDEQKAYAFLESAKTSLKVGGALFGKSETVVDELARQIKDIAEQEQADDEKEREDKVELLEAQFVIDMNKVNQGKPVVYNGQTYTTPTALYNAYQTKLSEGESEDRLLAKDSINAVKEAYRGNLDPREILDARIRQKSITLGQWPRRLEHLVRTSATNLGDDVLDSREYQQLLGTLSEQFQTEVSDFIDTELLNGNINSPDEGAEILDARIQKMLPDYKSRVDVALSTIQKQLDTKETKAANAEAVFVTTTDKLKVATPPFAFDDPSKAAARASNNIKVASLSTKPEQRQEAFNQLVKDVDQFLPDFVKIANGTVPKVPARKRPAFYGSPAIDFTRSYIETPAVQYSDEERQSYVETIFKVQGIRGAFMDTDVLESGVSPSGLNFKVKDLQPNLVRVLTKQEVEQVIETRNQIKKALSVNDLPNAVREKARILGYTGDQGSRGSPLEFFQAQETLYQNLSKVFEAGLLN